MSSALRMAILGLAVAAAPRQALRAPVVRPPVAVRYTNVEYHFSFVPPPGWSESPHPPALVVFAEPAQDRPPQRPARESNEAFIRRVRRSLQQSRPPRARANISVMVVPTTATTLNEYSRNERAELNAIKGCRVLGMRSGRLGGQPAIEHTIRVAPANATPAQTREVAVLRDGKALVVTLAAPIETFATYSKLLDRTLATFRWLP